MRTLDNEPPTQHAKSLEMSQIQKSVVILVHGIRTNAQWMHQIKPVLEADGFTVVLTNYGWFDPVQFLLPFFRYIPVHSVWTDIERAIQKYPNHEVSFIAHSFGTYIVSRILRKYFAFRAHRVIFCASVVHHRFPFEQITEHLRNQVVNEVGTHDNWPALAQNSTWGYGATGTFGFKRVDVHDRVHEGFTHSDFLTGKFCKEYWSPILKDDIVVKPGHQHSAISTKKRWLRRLCRLPIRYIAILVCLLTAMCIALRPAANVPEVANERPHVEAVVSEETDTGIAVITFSFSSLPMGFELRAIDLIPVSSGTPTAIAGEQTTVTDQQTVTCRVDPVRLLTRSPSRTAIRINMVGFVSERRGDGANVHIRIASGRQRQGIANLELRPEFLDERLERISDITVGGLSEDRLNVTIQNYPNVEYNQQGPECVYIEIPS